MYLRHTIRKKDGKVHRYWCLVRSVRIGRRVIQQTVAHLGELDEHGRVKAQALARRLIRLRPWRLFGFDGTADGDTSSCTGSSAHRCVVLPSATAIPFIRDSANAELQGCICGGPSMRKARWDCLVRSRRNKQAALRLMRKLIRKYRMVPSKF